MREPVGEPDGPDPTDGGYDAAGDHPEDERLPIGFILTIVMAGIYLAYRLWQGLVLFWDWVT